MSSRNQDRHDDMKSQNHRYNQGEMRGHKPHQGQQQQQPDQDFDQNDNPNTNNMNTTTTTHARSPDDKKRKRSLNDIEAEREARMARLRAENEQDEMKLVNTDQSTGDHRFGSSKTKSDSKFRPKEEVIQIDEEELNGLDEDEQMKLLLGFTGGFGSTKNTKVDDNHNTSASGAAAKNKARKYRQYMNRKNGFNRPLDKMN